MPSKNYTLFFILSVVFVLLSIGFITVIGQKSSSTSADSETDIRAKAGVSASLKFTGIVSSFDASAKTLIIENVQFENSDTKSPSMGTFSVLVASKDFTPAMGRPGTKLLLSVDAATFNASDKMMTAVNIQTR